MQNYVLIILYFTRFVKLFVLILFPLLYTSALDIGTHSDLSLLRDLDAAIGEYDHLENAEATPAWYAPLLTVTAYKNGGSDEDPDLTDLLTDCLDVYLEHAKTLPELTEEERVEKLEITVDYTDGLIEKGGISTDVFKSALGEETTKDFFDSVFFGTAAD